MEKFERYKRSENKIREHIQEESVHFVEGEYCEDLILGLKDRNESDEHIQNDGDLLSRVEGFLDTRKELKKILSLTPSAEKDEALLIFKNQLAEQYVGLGNLKQEMVNIFNDQSNSVEEKITTSKNMLNQYQKSYKLSPELMNKIEGSLNDLIKKHVAVNEFYNDHDGDAHHMYQALYNKEPDGNVSIHKGLCSLSFVCENIQDYARIHANDFNNMYLDDHKIKRSDMSGGVFTHGAPAGYPQLQETIIGINNKRKHSGASYDYFMGYTIKHEEQHAINQTLLSMFNYYNNESFSLYLAWEDDPKKAQAKINQYCNNLVSKATEYAKDEIIAYMNEGALDQQYISNLLTKTDEDGGLYDYMSLNTTLENIEYEIYNYDGFDNPEEIYNIAKFILTQKYKDIIEEGVAVYNYLKDKISSQDSIAALLITHKLRDWHKIVKYFKNQPSKFNQPLTPLKFSEIMPEEILDSKDDESGA